jgi:hypothetical protein
VLILLPKLCHSSVSSFLGLVSPQAQALRFIVKSSPAHRNVGQQQIAQANPCPETSRCRTSRPLENADAKGHIASYSCREKAKDQSSLEAWYL